MADDSVSWQPSANLASLRLRSHIIAQIRDFFADRGVLEVDTPLLLKTTASDPHIASFSLALPKPTAQTTHSSIGYLQTSPEFAMKRLLASGSGSIYQICKAFRMEECGRLHNPEFTMLEWYRVGFNHDQLMAEMNDLMQAVALTATADRFTYAEVFERFLGLNPHHCSLTELENCAHQHGLGHLINQEAANKDFWLILLLAHCIEPHLGKTRPVFIVDFPAQQAALAKINPDNPAVAERFELYWQGIELANGYHELTDSHEQERRFHADNAKRRALGLAEVPVDYNLLAAQAAGMPDCAGVALGIDRLIMLIAKKTSIAEVMSFGSA